MLGAHPKFFIQNTPFNLVLSAFLLLINHSKWNRKEVYALCFLFVSGFFIEVIGSNTGYLFGNYHYGKTLGFQVFNVPLVIGINWMMQIYIVGNMLSRSKWALWLKAIIGSMLLVFLDYFIEPVAIRFDYWQWENDIIPLTNYLCWFIISFLFLSLYFKTGFRNYNPLSAVLYFIQLLLFVILGLFS